MFIKFNDSIVLSGCLIVNSKKEILLLHRRKIDQWETPGGKVEDFECKDPNNLTLDELTHTAEREIVEELGDGFTFSPLKFFAKVEFKTPDGRNAIANKFVTSILSGNPKIGEIENFDKLEYLPIESLETYPISPDLRLLLDKVKGELKKD
jgi:8-oxo-dGTP pyrophosphatase MutT (NUDIX family)